MTIVSFFLRHTPAVLLACGCLFAVQTAEAGPPYGPPGYRGGFHHHHHHHHRGYRGPSNTAAIAFAVGAVANLMAPPPPPVVVHHHDYPRYRPYIYAPPVVEREIIYMDRPVPVTAPATIAPTTVAPTMMAPAPQVNNHSPAPSTNSQSSSGPSLTPVPDASFAQGNPQRPAIGTVVDHLPMNAMNENRGGVVYFHANGVYYLPIKVGNEPKFVVVQPQ